MSDLQITAVANMEVLWYILQFFYILVLVKAGLTIVWTTFPKLHAPLIVATIAASTLPFASAAGPSGSTFNPTAMHTTIVALAANAAALHEWFSGLSEDDKKDDRSLRLESEAKAAELLAKTLQDQADEQAQKDAARDAEIATLKKRLEEEKGVKTPSPKGSGNSTPTHTSTTSSIEVPKSAVNNSWGRTS